MGILKKMKGALRSNVNAAIDAALEPSKELDMIVMELEAQRGVAIKELLSYKASAIQMARSAEGQKTKALAWEKRAMIAIKKGDDTLAKECLERKRACEAEVVKIKRDEREAAGYAAELNASRKELDSKLQMLKLRKGTMATQIASARSGGGNAFGQSNELFDKLEEAERKIDEEIFAQEAAAELRQEEEGGEAELEAALLKAENAPVVHASEEDALAQLKAKMDNKAKRLKE